MTEAVTPLRWAPRGQKLAPAGGYRPSASGEIALTHAQLPADAPLATGHVTDSDDHLRTLGANAGQLVKVLPLSERN